MHDERLVQLALSRGFVTPEQVERARAEQRALADRGIEHSLFFLLQDLGFLREEDARELRRSTSSAVQRALEVEGFVIQGRIGSGGMGDVFRAAHPDGRQAAVKLLSGRLAKSPEYVRRFLREARAMSRLDHPHIVRVLSAGECHGTRYILMEYVEGPSLKSRIVEQGPLDERSAVAILVQIADGLRHAWQHGVLHRDVKPANILLAPPRPGRDEPFCAKLCDFGLARLNATAADPDLSRGGLTGTGLALGTPHYMSPEQATGEADLDQRSDIYGLGATLYHALLGHTLYHGKSSAVIMYKQVTEPVDLEALRNAGCSPALVDLLGDMLRKRREERIADWDLVLERARALPGAAALAAPAPAPPAPPPSHSMPPPAPLPATPPSPAPPRPSWWTPARRVAALVAAAALAAGLAAALWLAVAPGLLLAPHDELPAALARAAPEGTVYLRPGVYAQTMRLGATQRGLRLIGLGEGVVLAGDPALVLEPGAVGVQVERLAIASPGTALAAVGGSQATLRQVALTGRVHLAGSELALIDATVLGPIAARDRGRLHIVRSRLQGTLTAERADARLEDSVLHGSASVHDGLWEALRVRLDQPEPTAALTLRRATVIARELAIRSAGPGLSAEASEAPVLDGLSILSAPPPLAWQGPRQPHWLWQRLELGEAPLQASAVPTAGADDPAP